MVEPCPSQHPSGKCNATAAWRLGQRSPEFKASQIMTHWIFHSTSGCNLREKSELEIAFLKILWLDHFLSSRTICALSIHCNRHGWAPFSDEEIDTLRGWVVPSVRATELLTNSRFEPHLLHPAQMAPPQNCDRKHKLEYRTGRHPDATSKLRNLEFCVFSLHVSWCRAGPTRNPSPVAPFHDY